MYQQPKFYEMYEWGVFELKEPWTLEGSKRIPFIQFQNLEFVKEVVHEFLFRKDFGEEELSSNALFETKYEILNRMKACLGVECGFFSEYKDELSDDGLELEILHEYVWIRFSDGTYRGYHCWMNCADYCMDGMIYGDIGIEEFPVEEIPSIEALSQPVPLSNTLLFSQYLKERLEYVTEAGSFYERQSRYEHVLKASHLNSQRLMLESIQGAWTQHLQEPNASLERFIFLIRGLKEEASQHDISFEDPSFWMMNTNRNAVHEILDWTLSFFEAA